MATMTWDIALQHRPMQKRKYRLCPICSSCAKVLMLREPDVLDENKKVVKEGYSYLAAKCANNLCTNGKKWITIHEWNDQLSESEAWVLNNLTR